MIYFVKQFVGLLATPLILALLIAVTAAICRLCKQVWLSRGLLVCSILVAYLGSSGLIGDALLVPLERTYAPLPDDPPIAAIGYVVVLGTGYSPRDGIPVTAALDEEGLARVVEGIRLARRFGGVRLVVSGGAPPGKTPSALGYAELARSLGVDEASIIVLAGPRDTGEEAQAVTAAIGSAPFVLVTSAYHMRRAMLLMKRAGANPVAAPTGHRVDSSNRSLSAVWLPGSSGLRKTERALHEYMGLLAIRLGFE